MALYFYSYLTATQIITFGYIEWNPDVVLNGSFFKYYVWSVFQARDG